MSATIQSGSAAAVESKSAKKRKAKAEANASVSRDGTSSPAPDVSKQNNALSEQALDGSHDVLGESTYIKEINRYNMQRDGASLPS
jgi:hypothetical protein